MSSGHANCASANCGRSVDLHSTHYVVEFHNSSGTLDSIRWYCSDRCVRFGFSWGNMNVGEHPAYKAMQKSLEWYRKEYDLLKEELKKHA